MANEIKRQSAHLLGLMLVIAAQFVDRYTASVGFFIIALVFFIYAEYILRKRASWTNLYSRFESKFRNFMLSFERKDVKIPFLGAIWFYLGASFSFFLFPMQVATAAVAILAVADSMSTILGVKFGRTKIAGNKSLEGTSTFFIFALLTGWIVIGPTIALAGALMATFAEVLPATRSLRHHTNVGLIDDNFLIPLLSGFVMYLFYTNFQIVLDMLIGITAKLIFIP